jgi:hypothetical protein
LASGFNFAIPVSVVKEFLDAAKVVPEMSESSVLFNEGLANFYQQFYRRALDKFERVNLLNPDYTQLKFYMDQCNQKIERGNDRQSPPRKYVFWIMLVIAVVASGYLVYRVYYKRGA